MNKDYVMKQCILIKGKDGDLSQTAWIPSTLAKVNNQLLLKKDGEWILSELWTVSKVYSRVMNYSYLKDRENDYKNTRKASDI